MVDTGRCYDAPVYARAPNAQRPVDRVQGASIMDPVSLRLFACLLGILVALSFLTLPPDFPLHKPDLTDSPVFAPSNVHQATSLPHRAFTAHAFGHDSS